MNCPSLPLTVVHQEWHKRNRHRGNWSLEIWASLWEWARLSLNFQVDREIIREVAWENRALLDKINIHSIIFKQYISVLFMLKVEDNKHLAHVALEIILPQPSITALVWKKACYSVSPPFPLGLRFLSTTFPKCLVVFFPPHLMD